VGADGMHSRVREQAAASANCLACGLQDLNEQDLVGAAMSLRLR
jgi:hypothetical protein